MVTCPLCAAALDFDEEELDEGDELTCDECGEMVRVSSKEPLELEAVVDEEDQRAGRVARDQGGPGLVAVGGTQAPQHRRF